MCLWGRSSGPLCPTARMKFASQSILTLITPDKIRRTDFQRGRMSRVRGRRFVTRKALRGIKSMSGEGSRAAPTFALLALGYCPACRLRAFSSFRLRQVWDPIRRSVVVNGDDYCPFIIGAAICLGPSHPHGISWHLIPSLDAVQERFE